MSTRHFAIALAAVSCAPVVAACGSSGKGNQTGSSAQPPSLVSFANCMRTHGAPQFADPGSGSVSGQNGGVSIVNPGVDTSSSAFKHAAAACSRRLPGIGGAHHPADAQTTEETLRFSECMRAHGVTGFPDPTASPPSSLSGYSAVIRRGVYLAIPETINMASPTYKKAAAACRFGPAFS